ncbi:MAG: hypothetical protein KDK30_05820 [Leptospiraceae bacterium]|nr:hypothetical protein [Leptospiraceae bacterium]MCB1314371.1 hypothetical protein [Leptospiraceae bacterium]MCB1323318.1 hypothetical protein [Leptospiraceae bacterium]
MQIGSGFNQAQALNQISRSVDMINNLNQQITDASQDMANKLIKVSAESRVSQGETQTKLDLLA